MIIGEYDRIPDSIFDEPEHNYESCSKCGGCGNLYEYWEPAFPGQEDGDYNGRKSFEISSDEYQNMTLRERCDVEVIECPECLGSGIEKL